MRISLNWLKKLVKIDIPDSELVTLIGARLVEVEGVIDETHKYDKIFVAKVETAEKIPDTHLHRCMINVGDVAKNLPKVETDRDGLVQVMCGAPNVRAGMLAVWIAPGATVPASVHEDAPFVIGKRKMLGKYDSYGMLAGADELDFATTHTTIAEIDPKIAKPGDPLAEVFELNDLILDIENKSLTHRPDCFGLIGFAREVAGILGQKFAPEPALNHEIASLLKTSGFGTDEIDALANLGTNKESTVKNGSDLITISDPEICPRYTAIILEKHGELSKHYLTLEDTFLSKSGMRPLDPIVDVTNYLMLLTGQPLHAFDYDKFITVGKSETPKIIVRTAKPNEKLVLLDKKEITLNENDIVITSNNTPVALAGAMGGDNTAIDEKTRRIILESATFSLYNLRKTQMEHGIFSEAITRFTKGQPAYQTLMVAAAAAGMLETGFKISEIADNYPHPEPIRTVQIYETEINHLLGTSYDTKTIVKTLENVGFRVKRIALPAEKNNSKEHNSRPKRAHSGETEFLSIEVPLWRQDIAIKEDIIEEIGRLLGYDNITPVLPRHFTASENKALNLKTKVRDYLSRLGANEVLTYSFVSGKLLEDANLDPRNSYEIINSISPELQYVRQSLIPSLLDKAYLNQKIPYDKFALFEINKVYQKSWGMNDENVPTEKMSLGLVLSERKNEGTAYYKAKMYLEKLLKNFNVSEIEFKPLSSDLAISKPFENKRAALVYAEGELLGVVGEFKRTVLKNFKLAQFTAGFEIDFDKILSLEKDFKPNLDFEKEITTRDLTIATNDTYENVIKKVKKVLGKAKISAEITPISIYQPENEKHISIRLQFNQKISDEIMRELEKA